MEHQLRNRTRYGGGFNRTLEELVETYLASDAYQALAGDDKRGRRRNLRWWLDFLGPDLVLANLASPAIEDGLAALARGESLSGRPASPATRNRYLASLRKALALAVRRQWIGSNPAGKDRVEEPREPRGRVRYLKREEDVTMPEEAELPRFLAAAQEATDPRLWPAILITLSTGCRQGELFLGRRGTHTEPARWEDTKLHVKGPGGEDRGGQLLVRHDKSHDLRVLPVTGEAARALREYARVRPLRAVYVFENRKGECRFPRTQWEAVLRRAQITSFRFHDLRHSAASYLAMQGYSLAEIAQVLGHKTLQMVKRYAHLSTEHHRRVVAEGTQALIDRVIRG